MRRSALLAAVVLPAAASIAACASILGIEDGILEGNAGEGGVVICESDSGVQVDVSQVFVSDALGDDSQGCGTDQVPCKTIGAGLRALSNAPGAHLVYVANGTYNESIQLMPGVEIQGGWHARGAKGNVVWAQVCASNNEDQFANLAGSDSTTVNAENINGSATLTNIVVKTKAPGPGETVYGIRANAGTNLTLNHVLVDIGNGGDGADGKPGEPGSAGSGTCPNPSGGADGPPGDAGAGAPAIVLNATGAVAAPATAGADGTPGQNGMSGPDGGCVSCVSCSTGNCEGVIGQSCGSPGAAGCAGTGGGGGTPGQSGGSSIAIFAWGGAVIVNGGIVHAGPGGRGGAGGPGGTGGTGSAGAIGSNGADCVTTCMVAGVCIGNGATNHGTGGAAGTTGGKGGNGGNGGGGSGGDSFAIVSGLDASVLSDADIAPGPAGAPGAGGAPGTSAARFP